MLIIITTKCINNFKNNNIVFLEKPCSLKTIKNKNNILVIGNININNEGLIEELGYYIDEVFITVKIDLVISLKNNQKLKEVCAFYNIDLIDI